MSATDVNHRAGFRGYVTRTIKKIQSILSEPSIEVTMLEVQMKILRNLHEKVEALDEIIQSSLKDSSELQRDMDDSSTMTSNIEHHVHLVEKKLLAVNIEPSNNETVASVVKLPSLKLPYFTGSISPISGIRLKMHYMDARTYRVRKILRI